MRSRMATHRSELFQNTAALHPQLIQVPISPPLSECGISCLGGSGHIPITPFIRWDEKAGLHGMRYAPNDRRARSATETPAEKVGTEVDYQVAAPSETRTPTLHRANIAHQRVRMEGWRQRRLGSKEDHSTTKGNYKTDLTLTGLLMEGPIQGSLPDRPSSRTHCPKPGNCTSSYVLAVPS
jgi:hypothetical protein